MSYNFKTNFANGRVEQGRVRLKIIGTKTYLHLDGQSSTTGTTYAWIGMPAQARKLEQRARDRNEDWPYTKVKPKKGVPSEY